MDLFIDPTQTFEPLEKRAAEVDLPEDPNSWPQEILQELYKQVPYISSFEPHVQMDRVDAERGYGFGHVQVSNRTQMQGDVPMDVQARAGVREARVPIIIREGRLLPFDLLVTDDSRIQPLTEARLRQAIFRPQMFDVASKTPRDVSLISALYPPYRDSDYQGGAMIVTKHGSAGGSLLAAVLPTADTRDHQEYMAQLRDPSLRAAFMKNASASLASVQRILRHEPLSVEKIAEAVRTSITPSVAQIRRDGGMYILKTATHAMWDPAERPLLRHEVVGMFGAKIAMDVDTAGAVTVASDADAQGDEDMGSMAPVNEFGLYKVLTTEGDELIGYVIPNLLDVDGAPLPIALFTNGSQAAVQGSISGVPAATDELALPTADTPSGYGCFFHLMGDQAEATLPMDLQGSYSDLEEGEPITYMATTYVGRPVQVSVQPNIQQVVGTQEGKMLIPEHFQWLPLDKAGGVSLVSAEEVAEKTSARREFASVTVKAMSPTAYTFEGPAVSKLAYRDRSSIGLDEAMFLLAGLGVEQGYGTTKLAQAINASGPVRVRIKRLLRTPEQVKEAALRRAEARLKELPQLRKHNLLKEASVIQDPNAVDTVLSLGFINPENLMTFVSYLPTLEESQSKLCELLISARVGMEDVSTTALERAIRSLEETIEGLKALAFQGPG